MYVFEKIFIWSGVIGFNGCVGRFGVVNCWEVIECIFVGIFGFCWFFVIFDIFIYEGVVVLSFLYCMFWEFGLWIVKGNIFLEYGLCGGISVMVGKFGLGLLLEIVIFLLILGGEGLLFFDIVFFLIVEGDFIW